MSWNDDLVEAYNRGYRVRDDGVVVAPGGNERKVLPNPEGRLKFNIRFGFRVCTVFVHRLAAYQKFEDRLFTPGLEVRHLNNNCLDNSPGNLELGTKVQNAQDIPANVRRSRAKHAASFLRKLSDEEVANLRRDRLTGMTYKQLASKYGVTKASISYIVHSKTY